MSQATDSAVQAVSPRPRASLPVVVLAWIALLGVMYVARDLFIPIVFAGLMALLFRPALRRLRNWGVPDLVSALVLVGGSALLFSAGFLLLADQAQTRLAEAPETIRKVGRMLPNQSGPLDDLTETREAVSEVTTPENANQPVAVEVQSSDLPLAIVGVSGHVLGATIIVFVLAYFMLAFSETLLRQATSATNSFGQKRNVVETLLNVERGISTYLMTITTINIGLGAATALAMWLLGIPNPILWGAMATTLNFVPHVGAFVCLVVLFFVGSVTHESILYGALVASVFVILTSVESYFLTPMILSKSLQLSPLAVLLAILLFGWMWGIAGGLMAAPLLAVAKIVCDQFPELRVLAGFLAGEVRPKPQPEAGVEGAEEGLGARAREGRLGTGSEPVAH